MNENPVPGDQFAKIAKLLAHSCTVMNQNPPSLVTEYFQSEIFFRQFVSILKMIDHIWHLRKENPEQLPEWKRKHRIIFQLKSKLLKFLERTFGRSNLHEMIEKAEIQRKK